MIFRLFTLLSAATLCLSFSSSLQAQPTKPQAPSPTFRIISIVGNYNDLYYQVSSRQPDLTISVNQGLSQAFPVPADSHLEIYRKVPPPPDAPPETPPTKKVVISATLSATSMENIVMVQPLIPTDQDTEFTTRVISLRDSFKAGTCLIANFTTYPEIAVSINSQIHTVTSANTKLVSVTPGQSKIRTAVNQQGKWVLALTDYWRLSSNLRGYILVFPYIEDPDFPPIPGIPPAIVRINFEKTPVLIPPKS